MPKLPPVRGLYPYKFAYNIIQVMLCSYMCIEAGVRAYDAGYNLVLPCNPFNHLQPPIGFILYVFYLSKILDFLDTVFIILEKRWNQLSFLHVYHHFSIFLVSPCTPLSSFLLSNDFLLILFMPPSPLFKVLLAQHKCGIRWRCLSHHYAQWPHSYSHVYILLRFFAYQRHLVEICAYDVSDGKCVCVMSVCIDLV